MKKTALILLLSVVLAIGFSAPSFAGKKVCRLAHVGSPASVFHVACLAFEKAIEKELPDMDVQVYPAGQLGGTLALMQGLTLGTIDIYPEFTQIWADTVPEYKVFAVHYTFKDVPQIQKFMASKTYAEIDKKLVKRAGVTIIGSIDCGSTYNHFSNKALHTVADAKGLIGRVAQNASLVNCWKSYGAKPTSTDWGEVYTSLQTGVITAVDNPILDMYDEKFNEAVKYINMTNNLVNVNSFSTSNIFWKRLNDREKAAFYKGIEAADKASVAYVNDRLGKAIEDMKSKGIKVIQTDTSGFSKAIADNIEKILAGDKIAIELHKKIMAGKY